MRTLLVGVSLVALGIASGCTTGQVRAQANHGVAMHPCASNPFLRSTGLFGGRQPEIFLAGPDLRRGPPPAADSSTLVLNVTEVDNFRDPGADPVIDKCASWLQGVGDDEVELTILWLDRNCPDTFDEEDSYDCRSRTSFRFSAVDLDVQEVLESGEDLDAALQQLLVVDAYFTQEMQPAGRHSATRMPTPQRGNVHLVVRLIRAPRTADARGA